MNKQAKPTKGAQSSDRESLVRQAAYALYVQQGCVDGHELEHWIAAEALVDETYKPQAARPVRTGAREKASGNAAH